MQRKRMLIQAIRKLRFTMMTTFWRESAEYGNPPSEEDLAFYDLLGALERLVAERREEDQLIVAHG